MNAYVVLPNHYHVLVTSPEQSSDLAKVINHIHRYTAHVAARQSASPPGKIWWNYWDTCISFEASYFARLNYIHFNPVKHGYVTERVPGNSAASESFRKSTQTRLVDCKAPSRLTEFLS